MIPRRNSPLVRALGLYTISPQNPPPKQILGLGVGVFIPVNPTLFFAQPRFGGLGYIPLAPRNSTGRIRTGPRCAVSAPAGSTRRYRVAFTHKLRGCR